MVPFAANLELHRLRLYHNWVLWLVSGTFFIAHLWHFVLVRSGLGCFNTGSDPAPNAEYENESIPTAPVLCFVFPGVSVFISDGLRQLGSLFAVPRLWVSHLNGAAAECLYRLSETVGFFGSAL